jgi:hypothetical protein
MVRVKIEDDELEFIENATQDHISFVDATNAIIRSLNLNVPTILPFELILREARDQREFIQINLQFHQFLNDMLHSVLASLPVPVIFIPKILPASSFEQLKMIEYIMHQDIDAMFQQLSEEYNVNQAR